MYIAILNCWALIYFGGPEIPCYIVTTSLSPDLVLWSKSNGQLYIVELTICYETGFTEAAERKVRHYLDMAEDAQRQGYCTT